MPFLQEVSDANKELYVSNKLIQTHMLYGPNELEHHKVRQHSLREEILDNNEMDDVIQNDIQPYLNMINTNHIDAIDHNVQRPNAPVHNAYLRRLRCIYDVRRLRYHLKRQTGWVQSYPVDQPNDIRYAPIFIRNDQNYNKYAAIQNQKLNPHCLINIAENTAIFTDRDANCIYHNKGNAYHMQAPFCRVDLAHPTNQNHGYTPIAVTDNIHGGFDQLSNFMDPNRANNVAVLWNGNPDLTNPPSPNQRGLAIYRAWLAHNERKSISAIYAARVHINKFQPYYTDYKNIQLYWTPDAITRYHEWSNGTFCIIPSNCQFYTSWCAQPHNFDKQGGRLTNPTANSYGYIVRANTNNNQMNLPQINADLMGVTTRVENLLTNDNYQDTHPSRISGRDCYGSMDPGDAFIHHHHEDRRKRYNDPAICPKLGHSCLMHTILHSDLKDVSPQTLDGTNLPGQERIIRWRLGVPTFATHHIIRGHATAPLTGASWILFGKYYRPCRAKVQRIVLDLPPGEAL